MLWGRKNKPFEKAKRGGGFRSRIEQNRYSFLLEKEYKGEIEQLKREVPFFIVIHSQEVCKYYADFTYYYQNELIVEDTKYLTTPLFRLKKKLMNAVLGIHIHEIVDPKNWYQPEPYTKSCSCEVCDCQ